MFPNAMRQAGSIREARSMTLHDFDNPDQATLPGRIDAADLDLRKLPTQFGRYRLQRRIGGGGMGLVFLAEHTSLRQSVALKTIKPGRLDGDGREEAKTRFLREIEAAGSVIHPHVARATDAGEESGVLFLVTEFIDGLDLSEFVSHAGPLPSGVACELLRQACEGLQAIHEGQLVHRDIKPSNLLVSWGGHVKIVDLGLARFAHEQTDSTNLTETGAILGTLDFLAPEQAKSARQIDIRADLYSVGCTLVWLLTGKPVFGPPEYSSLQQRLLGHTIDEPDLTEVDRVAPQLTDLLRRLLAKKPAERGSTPAEVAAALQHWSDPEALRRLLAPLRERVVDERRVSEPNTEETDTLAVHQTDTKPKAKAPRRWWFRAMRWSGLVVAVALAIALGLYLIPDAPDPASAPQGSAPPTAAPSASIPPVSNAAPQSPPPRPALDSLPKNRWHNLLEFEPRKFFWDTGHNFVQPFFDAGSQQLNASCHVGLLEFGDTSAASYVFQTAIHQQTWNSGTGIYLGGRRADHREHPAIQFQTLTLAKARIGAKEQFRLLREQRIEIFNKQFKHLGGATAVAQELLGDLRGEQLIEISVVDGVLRRVSVNGRVLPGVTTVEANQAFTPDDCKGSFGAFIESSEAIFRNARFMASE